MSREMYVFNHSTLQYEKVEQPLKQRVYQGLRFLSAVVFTALILFVFAYFNLPTPKEKALNRDISQMQFYIGDLQTQYEDLAVVLDDLQKKDAEVHRVVFGMDPIDDAVWEGGIGGRKNIVRLGNQANANELLSSTFQVVERLKQKMGIQEASLEELLRVASTQEDKLASIPSIKPIQEDKLKRQVRHMSGYGMRIHPVHKVRKMHHGIDFTAPRGTPIQATGNGMVQKIVTSKHGYGNSIVIDHGYGYTTLYGHLSEIDVKKGDKVVKGQRIGQVGSTGTSTAPHCHYEVRINNLPVNPIDYCLDGLTPEEYNILVHKASEENQSFD